MYSIDESFLDVTSYLKLYGMTARELAQTIIRDVKDTVGTISSCGIDAELLIDHAWGREPTTITDIKVLYRRITDPRYEIRRVCITCGNLVEDPGVLQLSMFEDTTKQLKDKALQAAMLDIRAKFGKNATSEVINLRGGGVFTLKQPYLCKRKI